MIICKICNKSFSSISNTHVKNHGITLQEYICTYGNNIRSIETKQKMYINHSEMMRGLWEKGILKSKPISIEQKRKASIRMKVSNPMKNPLIARNSGLLRRGRKTKPRTLKQRLNISKSKLREKNPRWTGGEKSATYHLWDKDRKLALNRDNNTCVKCSMTNEAHKEKYKKGLHIHHINPYKLSKNNSIDNLITLCVQCHLKEENKSQKIVKQEFKK